MNIKQNLQNSFSVLSFFSFFVNTDNHLYRFYVNKPLFFIEEEFFVFPSVLFFTSKKKYATIEEGKIRAIPSVNFAA